MITSEEVSELLLTLSPPKCVTTLHLAKQLLRFSFPFRDKSLFLKLKYDQLKLDARNLVLGAQRKLDLARTELAFNRSFETLLVEYGNSCSDLKLTLFWLDAGDANILADLANTEANNCAALITGEQYTNRAVSIAVEALHNWFNKQCIIDLSRKRHTIPAANTTWVHVASETLYILDVARTAQLTFPYACFWWNSSFAIMQSIYKMVEDVCHRLNSYQRAVLYIEEAVYDQRNGQIAGELAHFLLLVERNLGFLVPWPFFPPTPSCSTLTYPGFTVESALSWLAESTQIVSSFYSLAWVQCDKL